MGFKRNIVCENLGELWVKSVSYGTEEEIKKSYIKCCFYGFVAHAPSVSSGRVHMTSSVIDLNC